MINLNSIEQGEVGMFEPHIREILEKLQQQIDALQPDSDDSKSILSNAQANVRYTLDKNEQHPNLTESLQEVVEHFEGTHPALTNVLSAALNVLSTGGV